MKPIPSVYASVYAFLLGTAALCAALASALSLSILEVPWPETAIFILFAVAAAGPPFAHRPMSTLALDFAAILASGMLFPLPVAILVAFFAAFLAAIINTRARLSREGLLATFCIYSGTLCALAASGAFAVSLVRRGTALSDLPGEVITAAVGFLAIGLAYVILLGTAAAMRGDSVVEPTGRYLRLLFPLDLVALPVSLLLVMTFRSGGMTAFLLLASLTALTGILMRRLDRTGGKLAEANRELTRRVRELQALGALGRELGSTLTPERVFEVVATGCRRIFPFDAFLAALYDAEARSVVFAVSKSASGAHLDERPLTSSQFIAWSLSLERPLVVRNARAASLPLPLRTVLVGPSIRSVMSVPFRSEERVTGIVCLQSTREGAYDSHDMSVMNTLAQQALNALESARNYQLSILDDLTGLYQRKHLFQRLQDELMRFERYQSSFALLMLDLDGFKAMNDAYGHVAGDRYLKALGETIRANLRGADIPCRYGGEEFAIVLPETDLTGATVIAERIREAVQRLEVREGRQIVRTTISIGVSMPEPDSGMSTRDMIRRADQALYAAKRAGRNRVVTAAA